MSGDLKGTELRRSMVSGEAGRLFAVPSARLSGTSVADVVGGMAAMRPRASRDAFLSEAGSTGVGELLRRRCAAARTRFGAALAHEVRSGRAIMVFGDYDVDGMSSTASMVLALSRCRAALSGVPFGRDAFAERALSRGIAFRLPERRDGYGLSVAAVEAVHMSGTRTVVCCDNGANAIPALARAEELGLSVLVVDHHPLGAEAAALWSSGAGRRMMCNPTACGPLGEILDDMGLPRDMCAAMVVDLVAAELFDRVGVRDDEAYGVALAGLATVTDVMPMVGANRVAVRDALELFSDGRALPGVDAMLRSHLVEKQVLERGEAVEPGLSGVVDADFFGFYLGPRLNACGRTGNAAVGASMILSTGDAVPELAARVEVLNEERKRVERGVVDSVAPLLEAAAALPSALAGMLFDGAGAADSVRAFEADGSFGVFVPGVLAVVASPGCDSGVAGLVASRISGRSGVPTLFMAMRGVVAAGADGVVQLSGSGRVPQGCVAALVSVGGAAGRVASLLGGGGGGHSAAFGLHLSAPADGRAFVLRLTGLAVMLADRVVADVRSLGPDVLDGLRRGAEDPAASAEATCDVSVGSGQLRMGLVRSIAGVGPYGKAFPEPLVHVDAGPCSLKPMGRNGSFMVDLPGFDRGVAVKGFAGGFSGGLAGGALQDMAARIPSEGCGLVGRLRPSFFGRGRAVREGTRWNGPGVEMILEAVVERRPASFVSTKGALS